MENLWHEFKKQVHISKPTNIIDTEMQIKVYSNLLRYYRKGSCCDPPLRSQTSPKSNDENVTHLGPISLQKKVTTSKQSFNQVCKKKKKKKASPYAYAQDLGHDMLYAIHLYEWCQ